MSSSRRHLPDGHWRTGTYLSSYGKTLTRLARYEEAEHLLLEAHQILSAARGDDDKYTVEAARALADLYDSWHEADPEAGHDSKTARWRAEQPRDEGEDTHGAENGGT